MSKKKMAGLLKTSRTQVDRPATSRGHRGPPRLDRAGLGIDFCLLRPVLPDPQARPLPPLGTLLPFHFPSRQHFLPVPLSVAVLDREQLLNDLCTP